VYQTASGDCEIKARVASVQNVNALAKSGVTIRETLNTGARNASVFVTPGSGVLAQWRGSTGGGTSTNQATGLSAPYWVRVVRTGNAFVLSRSADGTSWTPMSTQTVSMAGSVYLGLGVGSHVSTNSCIGTLDNVTATP
jgi:hypothetical protein